MVPDDAFCETDPAALHHELEKHHCRNAAGFDMESCNPTWWNGLSQVEQDNLLAYRKLWESCHQCASITDSKAVFVLNQDATERPMMSNNNGMIPTFTTNTSRIWKDCLGRWFTVREKLNAMGFPTFPSTAKACSFAIQ